MEKGKNRQLISDRTGIIAVFGVVALLCIGLGAVFLFGEFSIAVDSPNPVTVEVENGESLGKLVRRLSSRELLNNPRFFLTLAILRGDTGRVKAGGYVLKGRISPNELLDYLVSGKAKYLALTIPEGFSLKDIANRLEKIETGLGDEMLRLATDPGFIASLKLPIKLEIPTLEGFIFPETYYFSRGVEMPRLLSMMASEYNVKANQILQKHAGRVGMTPYQALIMASIIEKETGRNSERGLISAVFHNRLKTRMRLGSDPTVIYGIESFDGNLTRTHLRTKTKYNTYQIFGLPPTPIANPGLESIWAAVNPANVNFLFFVSKGDGSHFFSKDLKTHNEAVWKYQKKPSRKRQS